MTYRQIKWLILLIPTLASATWEYVRHEYLLPYISMGLGNILSPVIVFLVTMLVVVKLFKLLEQMKEDLEKEKAHKSILEEREKLSRELHDSIAQTLFLLSVKMNKLEKNESQLKNLDLYQNVKKTVKHVHEDVRQAIFKLRHSSNENSLPWSETLEALIDNFKEETNNNIHVDWNLDDSSLTPKEKIELYACIKEALINIRKHANSHEVWITLIDTKDGWLCSIEDDGIGFDPALISKGKYGLEIMKDRAKEMGWVLDVTRNNGKTKVQIKKEKNTK